MLVTGSRSGPAAPVLRELDRRADQIDCIVTGDADGVDRAARKWARLRGVDLLVGRAHWKTLGKRAGPRRNRAMLYACRIDLVLAFPGNHGTRNCVTQAEARRIKVEFVDRAR